MIQLSKAQEISWPEKESKNLKIPKLQKHDMFFEAALICGGDAASAGRRELVSREWLQETTERRRVKPLGARFVWC